MSASNFLENEVLDHILGEGNRNYSSPTMHVALLTGVTDGETNNVTEVSIGNGYGRKAVSFDTAVNGTATNTNTVLFDQATGGDWGTVSHAAIYDASTTGNLLFYGQLAVTKTITDGDTFQINNGALSISLT